jgi:hypothetical protein
VILKNENGDDLTTELKISHEVWADLSIIVLLVKVTI